MNGLRLGFVCGLMLGVGVAAVVVPSAAQNSSRRQAINLPGRTTASPFSDAVLVDDTLYLAGRLGLQGGQRPATPEEEARNVLDGIQSVLAEADMTMNDLVQVQVFCSDVSFFGAFNQVYTAYFTDAPPARAFIGSGSLLAGARFEVMGIAVKG
jgi:enamine deaminase RidA (YjgF/YER057c/UK114 family)